MNIEPKAFAGKLDQVIQYDLPKLEKNYSIRFLLPQHPSEITIVKADDLLDQRSVPFT